MRCTKAIIPVAGYGTRRLPITRGVEKCMLPIGNRPIVDYVVEDAIRAGIRDIYLVVDKDHGDQVRRYYQADEYLIDHLKATGKSDLIDLAMPPDDVNFHFIEQDMTGPIGTSMPAWLCREFIEPDEHFLLMMGDDFIYNPDGPSAARQLMETVEDESQSAMIGVTVPEDRLPGYGVIVIKQTSNGPAFDYIQEKPAASEAKGDSINVSKYLLHASFLDELTKSVAEQPSQNGEYLITDPINSFVESGHQLRVVRAEGQYLDGGTLDNWLEANCVIGGK